MLSVFPQFSFIRKGIIVELKVVLVGCGSIAGLWLEVVQKHPEWAVRYVGFVDARIEAAENFAARYAVPDVLVSTDLEVVLRQTQPDIVFDCTPPDYHHATTLTALAHGCHVLGEKPLATSLELARDMIAAAEKAGRCYGVMQNRRFDPNLLRLKRLIHSGEIGAITTLHCDFFNAPHFIGFRETMPHPLLFDMAIHTFDAARYLLNADPVAVYCHEWNPSGTQFAHGASAVAVFEMTGGIVYTYRGSWAAEGVMTTWEAEWRALGENGSATWDGAAHYRAQKISATGGFFNEFAEVELPPLETLPAAHHAGGIEDFIRAVRTGGTPLNTGSENIKSLAMVFAAIESAETGQRVAVRW